MEGLVVWVMKFSYKSLQQMVVNAKQYHENDRQQQLEIRRKQKQEKKNKTKQNEKHQKYVVNVHSRVFLDIYMINPLTLQQTCM